ncbi:MAG: amidohydrolase family protein [Gemmatimonadetes bacterium]|nr:amidohydrolase family protein [Gemmatimonadota bacterium]
MRVLPLLLLAAACSKAPSYDLVLAGGRVMDPASGLDSVRNIGITGGQIAAISADPLAGTTVVDVSGHVVAPGFIDLHAHGQTEGDMELQAQDGVTTALEMEVGVYPVAPWYQSREGKSPINFGATVSHIASRFYAFHGVEIGHWLVNREKTAALIGPMPAGANEPASEAQIEKMGGAIRQGLSEGALGVGFGINYVPAASGAEIEQMFAIAAERKVPVFVHTRAFGIAPIREAITTARKTGAALHVVHLGSSSGSDAPAALALIDSAKAAGQDLTTEVYPYTAASTALESALFNPGWQSNLKIDYGDLAWAATGERLTKATFDKYRKEGGWVIIYMMKDEFVDQVIGHPGVMIASDGVPFVNGTGHPRGAGSFARVLGHYSRERKVLGLMDALSRMTILPARRLETAAPAMAKKGRLAVGADADITVFNPETVIDRATFQQPTQPSAGIPHVLVGGAFVVRDGQLVKGAMPGKPIRTGAVPTAQ